MRAAWLNGLVIIFEAQRYKMSLLSVSISKFGTPAAHASKHLRNRVREFCVAHMKREGGRTTRQRGSVLLHSRVLPSRLMWEMVMTLMSCFVTFPHHPSDVIRISFVAGVARSLENSLKSTCTANLNDESEPCGFFDPIFIDCLGNQQGNQYIIIIKPSKTYNT
jgi:hypothetical protein